MNILRIHNQYSYKLVEQLENQGDTIILGDSLIYLNHSTNFLFIPIKFHNIIFHLICKTKEEYNKYLPYYNEKNISFLYDLEDEVNLFFDLDFNVNYIFNNQNTEFKEYLHPYKQKKDIKILLEKDLKLFNLKFSFTNLLISYTSKTVSLLSLIKKYKKAINWTTGENTNLLKEYQITNFDIFIKNEIDNKKDFLTLIKSYIKKDRWDDLKKKYWEQFVKKRIIYEANIIQKKKFTKYFLNYLEITSLLDKENIMFLLKGSAVGSLLLYVTGISHINPIKYNISFDRFLWADKIADIDIDIPSTKRDEILELLNTHFKKQNLEVFLILNKSSENFDKLVVHPSWILLENYKELQIKVPVIKTENLPYKIIELFNSWTLPILEKYNYLKYDLIRSNILEEISVNKNIHKLIQNWEETIKWDDSFYTKLLEGEYFQMNSESAKNLLKEFKPNSFEDLVKIVAINRPVFMRNYKIKELATFLHNKEKYITQDLKINQIINSSFSWKLLLYQDQVIDLLNYIVPEIELKEIMNLIKGRSNQLNLVKEKFIKTYNQKSCTTDWQYFWKIIKDFHLYWMNKGHSFSYWFVTYLQLFFSQK